MAAWTEVEQSVTRALSLSRRPVAVAFRDTAPAGVTAFAGAAPSGCSFWRLAAAGRRLLHGARATTTTARSAVHTHAISAAVGRASPELPETLSASWPASDTSAWRRCRVSLGLPRTPGVRRVRAAGEDLRWIPTSCWWPGRPGRVMLLHGGGRSSAGA